MLLFKSCLLAKEIFPKGKCQGQPKARRPKNDPSGGSRPTVGNHRSTGDAEDAVFAGFSFLFFFVSANVILHGTFHVFGIFFVGGWGWRR